MNLKPRVSVDGKVEPIEGGWRLEIPAGDARRYRLAQIDDHLRLRRSAYPYQPPMRLGLDARASSNALPGTWGFGLWNDPYGFSFGPGNGFLTLPALPNAAWFFCSSPVSYLSFRDDKPGTGFLAQVFSSPRFHPRVLSAALMMPFSRRGARRELSRVIQEDAAALTTGAALDVTQWHHYDLEWRPDRTTFRMDERTVLDTPVSPRGPLGIVIWIDNQHAAFSPTGKISFGLEPNPSPAWFEVRNLSEA